MKNLNFSKFLAKVNKNKVNQIFFGFLFVLVILAVVLWFRNCLEKTEQPKETFGQFLWAKRNLALNWAVEFEGEIKELSSNEITLKINEEEMRFSLDSQALFLEQKLVEVEPETEGVPIAYNLESQPISPDDFVSQIGKKARVFLTLIGNDLKGIQVIVAGQ